MMYDILSLRRIQPCRYIDNNVIGIMRIRDELVSHFTDMGCVSLLNADWRSYKPMVVEFLSTFQFKEHLGEVRFRLGNQPFNINKGAICDIFNWPEDAESVPPNFEDNLWEELTVGREGSFNAHTSNIAGVPYFAYRYFHHVLTCTIFGHSESNHRVSKTELEILYYFHYRKRADLAGIFLRRFHSVAERNVGSIGIGGFITAIAIHLANFDLHATNLDFVPGPTTVDGQVTVNMKILAKGSLGQLQYIREPRVDSETESEDEDEEERGREGKRGERDLVNNRWVKATSLCIECAEPLLL